MAVAGEEGVESPADINDDLTRETYFYEQALASANVAIKRLKDLGIAVKRPEDFYAEMVKSDEHMKRVRAELIFEQTSQVRQLAARLHFACVLRELKAPLLRLKAKPTSNRHHGRHLFPPDMYLYFCCSLNLRLSCFNSPMPRPGFSEPACEPMKDESWVVGTLATCTSPSNAFTERGNSLFDFVEGERSRCFPRRRRGDMIRQRTSPRATVGHPSYNLVTASLPYRFVFIVVTRVSLAI
jgi:hypothetical protein